MKRRITVSRILLTWMLGFTIAFFLIIGVILQRNFKEISDRYRQNLQFRSSLFKESIESSIIMGDYSSVVAKADSFFAQSDVAFLEISLRDGTNLFKRSKEGAGLSERTLYNTTQSISIKDRATQTSADVSVVEVSFELLALKDSLNKFIMQGIIASLFFLGATISFSLYISRRFNSPLKRLSEAALSGDLQIISRVKNNASIAEVFALESAMQQMGTQLIDLNEKEKENFKNAAVGRIIAHLSHDLRAPLAVFERAIHTPDQEISSIKPSLRGALDRLYSMVESLRHSEVETIVTKSTSVLSLKFGLESLLHKARKRHINVFALTDDLGMVCIDPMKFERAWVNLATNALDFAKTKVQIEVEFIGTELILRIIDDGPGVPDEFVPRLFQRGATHGKTDGTGLGLAYVRQIMRGHGGDVTYRRANDLTIFECRLPNAVIHEKGEVLENAASLELQLTQKAVRTVAICLDPPELSKSVLTRMSSFESEDFLFIEDRNRADVVVSNLQEIMIEVLENDEQEYVSVSQLKGDEARIVALLGRKFELA